MGKGHIGIFDSGYGGLTVLKNIVALLPEYDYMYLGDNARAPYGPKSFELVYQYTIESVAWLFDQGCELVVLACNTASAKALRKLQREWLPVHYPEKKVLGVIRPTAEYIGHLKLEKPLGILGTTGTVSSKTYVTEINNYSPQTTVYQQACPLWVPFIEDGLIHMKAFKPIISKDLDLLFKQNKDIQNILLACTHYPLILDKLNEITNAKINFISQGPIVANSLADYFQRHIQLENKLGKNNKRLFFTTDDAASFTTQGSRFYEASILAEKITLNPNKS